ncbi:MAG: SMP-30/gluconolactonase/LRE family protein [Alphaproteobacteria bacterium]|nr:SMP-30/gluconolactonase/LRE family protein [Alphaproteobacteria bacterium]
MDTQIQVIQAELWSRMPDALRLRDRNSSWVAANKPGAMVECFLEGPAVASDGSLWVVDIPYGRILRIAPEGTWTVMAEYDGWPNGMRCRPDGSFCIADYKRGILRLDPQSGTITPIFEGFRSEGFKGCNDLWFAQDGTLFFTDQGQTGLHDPSGRVYRAAPNLRDLEVLLDTGPSPNGLVTNYADTELYVAMTRSCEIWRLPLFETGTSKVGLFARLPAGRSGPDGLALDRLGNLYVCHASRGAVFVYNPHGDQIARIECQAFGLTTTNLAFGGDKGDTLFITVSDTGMIARASVASLLR